MSVCLSTSLIILAFSCKINQANFFIGALGFFSSFLTAITSRVFYDCCKCQLPIILIVVLLGACLNA